VRLTNHCFAVTGLGYLTPWCVNAGFVTGSETTLIVDAGPNTLAAQTIHGYASAAKPGNMLEAVNTEMHFDHIGGNGYLHGLQIEIWGRGGAARTPEEFQAEIAEFNQAIPDPVRRARGEASAFFYDTHLASAARPIKDGARFQLGAICAEICFTPGHTPANLSVWAPQEGVLYTGDCVVREFLPNLDAGGPEDWEIWLESLDRIQSLKPEFLVPGHGPVARGTEIDSALDSMRRVLQEAIDRGLSPTSPERR